VLGCLPLRLTDYLGCRGNLAARLVRLLRRLSAKPCLRQQKLEVVVPASLNKVLLIGNLTRDPELKALPSGQHLVSFGLATNRTYKDKNGQKQEATEFHNIVAWTKLAEICAQLLKKGRKVYVEGRLQTRSWQAQDGTQKQRTEIVINDMIILDRKTDESANMGGVDIPEPVAEVVPEIQVEEKPKKKVKTNEKEETEEDIPF